MSAKLTDQRVNGKFPFQYAPSFATDLAATFARIKKEMSKPTSNVQPIRRRAK